MLGVSLGLRVVRIIWGQKKPGRGSQWLCGWGVGTYSERGAQSPQGFANGSSRACGIRRRLCPGLEVGTAVSPGTGHPCEFSFKCHAAFTPRA